MDRSSGDSEKINVSSDEESVTNHSRNLEKFGDIPQSPLSDDNDRQFWASDELSIIESRSNMKKRKRRHSLAYRNRIYRSRSRCQQFSSSEDNAEIHRRKHRNRIKNFKETYKREVKHVYSPRRILKAAVRKSRMKFFRRRQNQ